MHRIRKWRDYPIYELVRDVLPPLPQWHRPESLPATCSFSIARRHILSHRISSMYYATVFGWQKQDKSLSQAARTPFYVHYLCSTLRLQSHRTWVPNKNDSRRTPRSSCSLKYRPVKHNLHQCCMLLFTFAPQNRQEQRSCWSCLEECIPQMRMHLNRSVLLDGTPYLQHLQIDMQMNNASRNKY